MSPERKPNLLFLYADQHRADVMGCAGNDVVVTPHLDRLAAEGVRFDQAWTESPVCQPARASLLTGRFPSDHGVLGNFGVGPFPFDSIYAQVCGETADHQRWTELQRPPARNPSMRLRTTLCSRLRACARVLARRRSRTQSAQASPPPPGSST